MCLQQSLKRKKKDEKRIFPLTFYLFILSRRLGTNERKRMYVNSSILTYAPSLRANKQVPIRQWIILSYVILPHTEREIKKKYERIKTMCII